MNVRSSTLSEKKSPEYSTRNFNKFWTYVDYTYNFWHESFISDALFCWKKLQNLSEY